MAFGHYEENFEGVEDITRFMRRLNNLQSCHSREGGNPYGLRNKGITAGAGMTLS